MIQCKRDTIRLTLFLIAIIGCVVLTFLCTRKALLESDTFYFIYFCLSAYILVFITLFLLIQMKEDRRKIKK